MLVETELCGAASEALTRLGFDDFTIRLNHRQALRGVLEAAGVSLTKHEAALIALDKLDKIGREGVRKELSDRGIGNDSSEQLLDFFGDLNSLERPAEIVTRDDFDTKEALNAAILGRMVAFVNDNECGVKGIDELRLIVKFSAAAGFANRIKVDPSLARGLSYYTGAIMEITVKDLAGSLGGGGRYDNLVGMFLDQDVPACGFSLGMERIIVMMSERELFPPAIVSSPADLMVSIWNENAAADSISLARDLRKAGFRVDLYPDVDKVGKQIKYASSRGIPFVAIIGDDERSAGKVSLKDLRSGEQRTLTRETIAQELHSAITRKSHRET